MKKNLLILAVAGLALASCSNDETVAVNQGDAISFRPLISNVTRAADEHFNVANDQFGVTAMKQGTTTAYFDNITFKTTDGSTFTSQNNKYYWPSSTNLDFYAFAPLPSEVTTEGSAVTRGNYNTFTVTPGTSVPNQPDFVYAVTKDWGKASLQSGTAETHQIGDTYKGVTINFSHAESKVLIQLKNTNDNLIFTVGNVTIGNLRGSESFTWNGVTDGTTQVAAASANTDGQYTTGTLTYLNGTWTAASTQTSAYTVAMGTDDIDGETEGVQARNILSGEVSSGRDLTNTAANHEMILIPQELRIETTYNGSATGESASTFDGAYITVQIKIQNKATNDYIVGDADDYVTAMWPLTALTWLPGHKYTYTVDLAGGGYYTTNQDTNNDLDPILEGAEIKFVNVTVDEWADAAGIDVAGPTE